MSDSEVMTSSDTGAVPTLAVVRPLFDDLGCHPTRRPDKALTRDSHTFVSSEPSFIAVDLTRTAEVRYEDSAIDVDQKVPGLDVPM